MAPIVVVLDFDKTIIDTDSDHWVVDELGVTDLYNQLLPTMPFNTLMDTIMNELHAQNKTIKDIEEVLRRVPVHPRIVEAIKSAHALGCDLRIVSDANTFFIETILSHLGIRECFSEINTNPGIFDDKGRLRIFPFHDFPLSSHGCERCPPNMCKGLIIERIQASLVKEEEKKWMIYVGDGSNDFCPSLKLQERDFMMPRKDFPVWELICKNRSLLKCEIREWTNGADLERVLLQIIDMILFEEDSYKNGAVNLLSSEECKKLERIQTAAHPEVFPQVLPKLVIQK